MLGVADGDSLRKVAASSASSRLRRQRGGDRVGGSGRAADAGKAVDDERRPAVPAPREIEQRAHMIFARRRHVGLLDDDVVHRQDEVVVRGAGWPAG